jgi:hypothetical protein
MPIDLYWDDEHQRTLLCSFDGHWSWDELFAVLRKIKQLTEELDHAVAAIIDVRKGVHLPDGLFTPQTLSHAQQLLKMRDENTGKIVIVGVNPIIRAVFEAVRGIDPQAARTVHFAETVKQARDYL